MEELEQELKKAHELARRQLKSEILRTKRDYDIKAHKMAFKRGDIVLLLNKAVKKGESSKLTMPWKEQGIITEVLSPCTYKVQIGSWAFKVCHHDSLKVIQEEEETLPNWLIKVKHSISTGTPITYCYCKQPDDGSLYVECKECSDWFHTNCAKIRSKSEATQKRFICKLCKEKKKIIK